MNFEQEPINIDQGPENINVFKSKEVELQFALQKMTEELDRAIGNVNLVTQCLEGLEARDGIKNDPENVVILERINSGLRIQAELKAGIDAVERQLFGLKATRDAIARSMFSSGNPNQQIS